jgi:hypothetical protein
MPAQAFGSAQNPAPAAAARQRAARSPLPAWTTYHGGANRWGTYPEQTVAGLRPAWTSSPLDGPLYAEPIWQGGRVYVATENDTVYALNLATGRTVWRSHLGTPVPLRDLPCGDIDPLGITGTPVLARGRLFVAAELAGGRQRLFALDAQSGRVLASYSLDFGDSAAIAQQQRGALTYLGGTIYVPLGGLYGDCGDYVGQVVAVRPGAQSFAYRVPTVREGAIWAPAGLSVGAGGALYAATGNSASLGRWDGGDSVLRLSPALRLLSYFTPRDFAQLNAQDLDLGSTAPLPLPGGLLFQIGKSGVGYLLNEQSLGGIGHPLYSAAVCAGAYGGDAWNGRQLFVPCTDGLVALAVVGARFHTVWRSLGWDAGPPAVGGAAVFSVDESKGSLRVLRAASGREIAEAPLRSVPHFDSPTLAPGLVLVDSGRQVRAFSLLPRPPTTPRPRP